MKKIEVIIPDRKLPDVISILKEAKVGGISYYRIEGRGQARPITVGRGTSDYLPEFIPRLKVEAVVRDEQVEGLITKIVDRVGGDISTGGKIFVVDVPAAVDLATKKRGEAAI